MRVIIRLRTASETAIAPGRRPNRRLADGIAPLLGAVALGGFAVCVWRWGNDLHLLHAFPFAEGILSRWQVWFGLGLLFQALSATLANYARGTVRRAQPGTPWVS